MIGILILVVLLLGCLLGTTVLAVRLQWISQYLIHPYLLFALFGFSITISILGLIGLENLLACWITTSC